MYLIVGLGNPGKQYERTPHNVGREIVSQWQKKSALADFEFSPKLKTFFSKNKKAVLLLPETGMNKSGNAVRLAARFFKVKPGNVIVLHDDADIELGRTKLSFGRHSAGHRGVESVKRVLDTWDFWRLRIGIQKRRRVDAMKLVLQKFAPAEEQIIKKTKKKLLEGLETAINEGPERAMN